MALRTVNRLLLAECSRRGAFVSVIRRCLTGRIRKTPLSGYVLTSLFATAHCESQPPNKHFKEPDPSKLTQDYLLKNASSQTADTVTAVLSQAARSVIDAEENYTQVVKMLINLTKYHLSVLGTQDEERIWDMITDTRIRLDKCNEKRKELNMLFSCVEKLVDSSAEVAFLTGAEYVSTSLGERLHNAKFHVDEARKESRQVETELREVQAVSVRAIGEHADKEEKLHKLQEDVDQLVKEGKTKDLAYVGKTLLEKGKLLAEMAKNVSEETQKFSRETALDPKTKREMDDKRMMDMFEIQS